MKTNLTKTIEDALFDHLNPLLMNKKRDQRIYIAKEVTYHKKRGNGAIGRVDMMRFKPLNNSISGVEKGDFFCYEIKISKSDFKSKNGHNHIGDYNYYVIPIELYNDITQNGTNRSMIPFSVGVMVYEDGHIRNIMKARRIDRMHSTSELLLMMFRSANRETFSKEERL